MGVSNELLNSIDYTFYRIQCVTIILEIVKMQNWLAISLLIVAGIFVLVGFYQPYYCKAIENLSTCPIGDTLTNNGQKDYTVLLDNRTITYGKDLQSAITRWKQNYPDCDVPSKWHPNPLGPQFCNETTGHAQTCAPVGYCCGKKDDEDCCTGGECEGGVCVKTHGTSPKPSPHPEVHGKVVCYITEYNEPPDDTNGPPSHDEMSQLNEHFEEFRISGGGRGGGGRRPGGGGGIPGRGGGGRRPGGGGGIPGRGGGGRRPGGGGRRPGGGGMVWPWRTWPRRHYGRPWRSWWWRSYPEYVYTYPLTYYDNNWEAPIERFSIRIGPKNAQHPFVGEGSDLGYMITQGSGMGCGTSGARLELFYGRSYEFDIYTSSDCVNGKRADQPFFFTTDRHGGSANGALFAITPTVNGTIRITITDNLPSQFYYQSTNGRDVGGYVLLR